MSYYINKDMNCSFAEAVEKTKAVLKEQGFGVITEINMKSTLKEKIGEDIPEYLILGACSPKYAFHALQLEDKIGLMLPCNVIVREDKSGKIEVAAIDPIEAMNPVDNDSLGEMAQEVRDKLESAINNL